MERHENALDLGSFERIPSHLPVTSETDQPIVTQTGKVLRYGRLAEPDQSLQLDNRSLAFGKEQQDAQTLRIAHRAKKRAGLFRMELLELEFHGLEFISLRAGRQSLSISRPARLSRSNTLITMWFTLWSARLFPAILILQFQACRLLQVIETFARFVLAQRSLYIHADGDIVPVGTIDRRADGKIGINWIFVVDDVSIPDLDQVGHCTIPGSEWLRDTIDRHQQSGT